MKDPRLRTIAIVGVGLIGGSLGLSIRRRMPGVRVIGVDKKAVIKRALARKAIDLGTMRLESAVSAADLVILATPVEEMLRLLPRVARAVSDRTVVTDVGSVKESVIRQAARLFPAGNFVGGHPMAGLELSGIEAAHPLLFENALYVLTPLKRRVLTNLNRVALFVRAIGARPVLLDARTHDEVAAAVSHMPQLVAVGLMNVVGKKHPAASRNLQLAAGGFRDLTRVASSTYDLWAQILPANREKTARALRLLIRELRSYERILRQGRVSRLAGAFGEARALRNRIPKDMKGFLRSLAVIQVFVPDRPGMLARMTTAISRAGVNIKDIELAKVREGTGGTFRLSFSTREEARRAAAILRARGFQAE